MNADTVVGVSVLAAAWICASGIVLADDEEADAEEVDGSVVVTATRSESLVRDQPVRVEVVPEEEIEENLTIQPGNVTTLLNELGGLRMQTVAPGLGGTGLELRGLPGRHTLVLLDGLPLLGAQTDGFGLLQTPPLDLARVEVIKGVASALYGDGALGGVVNLVSRTPGSEPELLLNRTSLGGTDVAGFVSGPLSAAWGYTLTGGFHHQSREDLDRDAWADVAGYRRTTLRPRFFWQDASGHSVFSVLGFAEEERNGGSLPGRTLPDGSTFREALNTRRIDAGMVGRFQVAAHRQLSARWSAAQTTQDRTFGVQRTQVDQTTALGEVVWGGSDGGHAWVIGAGLAHDRLKTPDVAGVSHSYTTLGVFVQDEYSPADAVSFSASARLDAHSDYGTFLSPRVSALLRISEEWQLRASFGAGFAAPTPLVGDIETTGLGVLAPLGDLHAERARNAALDARWKAHGWEINGSLFTSRIEDALDVRATPEPGRLEIVNTDGQLRVDGAELLLSFVEGPLHVLANGTYLDSTEDAPGAGRRSSDLIPRYSAELAVLLEDETRGRVGFEISRTGSQRLSGNPYRTSSEPYVELNLLAEIKFGETSIFLNAINLTGVRQTDYDSLVLPSPGPGGQRTTDVWAPLAGRVFNLGVRLEL